MARTASEASIACKQFIIDNPESTFKNFKEEHPDTEIAPTYFSVMKSNLKKNGEIEGTMRAKAASKTKAADAKPAKKAKVEDEPKAKKAKAVAANPPMPAPTPKVKAAAGNGNGKKKKIEDAPEPIKETMKGNKAYLTWLETGLAKGFVEKLRDRM